MPGRGAPPPGLEAPERGFGYVWGVRDDFFEMLGWATDRERGFCARVQDFDRGFVLVSSRYPRAPPDQLFNQATSDDWRPLRLVAHDENRWPRTVVSHNPARTASRAGQRPDNRYAHPRTAWCRRHVATTCALTLALTTGRPRGCRWTTSSLSGATTPVPTDLSGRYQLAWDDRGLLLALRVRDDQNRPGPVGSDLWQGDSVEIHLDRRLLEDFDDAAVNGDDYQIGLAFDESLAPCAAIAGYPMRLKPRLALRAR